MPLIEDAISEFVNYASAERGRRAEIPDKAEGARREIISACSFLQRERGELYKRAKEAAGSLNTSFNNI